MPTSSVLVTGASSGLGLVTSTELAAAGLHVVMACRSVERGEAAAAQIRATHPAASVEILELDLASLASVRSAAATVVGGDRPPLQALVCNAGIQIIGGIKASQDGYELTFATNHLGHFLLVELLLDQLVEPARIVMVSSEVHQGPLKSMGFPAPQWESATTLADPLAPGVKTTAKAGRVRYANSKLANLYFTYELARRLGTRKITVNAFDPGLMPETSLDRDYPGVMQAVYGRMAPLLHTLPGARSVLQSGSDLAWMVTAPELAGVTGAYYSGRKRRNSSKESHDTGRGTELWAASEKLVATG